MSQTHEFVWNIKIIYTAAVCEFVYFTVFNIYVWIAVFLFREEYFTLLLLFNDGKMHWIIIIGNQSDENQILIIKRFCTFNYFVGYFSDMNGLDRYEPRKLI